MPRAANRPGSLVALGIALAAAACTPADPSSTAAPTVPGVPPSIATAPGSEATASLPAPTSATSAKVERPKKTGVEFLEDYARAVEKAKAEGKALFVDAWAPWCHTCLSMQGYVLNDPALVPFAERVVFVAIDTDRDESARFLEKHSVSVWPTFFVLDPSSDQVFGYWPGSASLAEVRGFLEDALRALEASKAGGAGDEGAMLLSRARAAHASRKYDAAASAYRQAVAKLERGSRRWSEAKHGLVQVLRATRDYRSCAREGKDAIADVQGAALPADLAHFLLSCADKLGKGKDRDEARAAAIARLRKITSEPPPDASPDDRADALAILGEALAQEGDKTGARRAHERRLAIMEKAAAEAPAPEIAATYDYGRALAYLALGRGEEAVRMLEEREKQMPDSYEPPARLASVLAKMGRLREALAAIDRAIPRAYGPRKLGYLRLKADIQGHLGDRAGRIATLRAEVAGYERLPNGHFDAEDLADARARLEAAQKGDR